MSRFWLIECVLLLTLWSFHIKINGIKLKPKQFLISLKNPQSAHRKFKTNLKKLVISGK